MVDRSVFRAEKRAGDDTSGGLGGMGYGFPAAIGAGFGNPDRQIVCVSGDGGVQMNIQELATAVINEIPVVVCIFKQWLSGYGKTDAGLIL